MKIAKKITIICFVLLIFLLIGTVSASSDVDETSEVYCNASHDTILSKNIDSEIKLEAVNKTPLSAVKKTTVSKKKVILSANNVKMYCGDGTKFKVTLKDSNKKAIKNANIKMQVNLKTYTKKTDSKGVVNFNVNLNAGKYKVLISYDGSGTYQKKSISKTLTVKGTIQAHDQTKFYKNKAVYSAKFLDLKGKVLKNTKVKYSLNKKSYEVKTDKKGMIKVNVNLKPGKYQIGLGNSNTGEVIYKIITIKSTIEQKSFTMNSDGNVKYCVKIYNSNGKAYASQKVTFKVDSKSYIVKSDRTGIATLNVKLTAGKHNIIASFDGINIPYSISVTENKVTQNVEEVKETNFTHTTLVPSYVNVTTGYAFKNDKYVLKEGEDGIIKMPKTFMIRVDVKNVSHIFTTYDNINIEHFYLDYGYYMIPFNGSEIQHSFKKESLEGSGIILSIDDDYLHIDYTSRNEQEPDFFGVFMNEDIDNGETITYLHNSQIVAVNLLSTLYDDDGVKYNLAKTYSTYSYTTYEDLTNGHTDLIKYVKTNESVGFTDEKTFIRGNPSREDIITKFTVNGVEQFEKNEVISYGASNISHTSARFEVLQSYAIINKKIDKNIVSSWIDRNITYLIFNRISNLYQMFLVALETTWLADELANQYASELNLSWSRDSPITVMGGINENKTYIHVLNADMGMNITGSEENKVLFRLMNSIYLPNIEEYCLLELSEIISTNSTNSLDNILLAMDKNNFSIVQMGEIFYILSENGSNSTIVINSTSGVSEVITSDGEFAYKGSSASTNCDCCSILSSTYNTVVNVYNTCHNYGSLNTFLNKLNNKITPICTIGYKIGSLAAGLASGIIEGGGMIGITTATSIIGPMVGFQSIGVEIRERLIDKQNWHTAYDSIPLTRSGILQYKKCFNIPKSNGEFDYIEVNVKNDGSLDRNSAIYISSSGTKQLTKEETYKYFSEDKWVTWNIPKKYQKYKVPF